MPNRHRVVLFDLDGTLLRTFGAGLHALAEAAQTEFGHTLDPNAINAAGRLDPQIMADLLADMGLPASRDRIAQFHAGYRTALPAALERGTVAACPGACELLDILERTPGVTLGLLTGNCDDTGPIKMRACGIDPERFPLRLWANDADPEHPERAQLPAAALERARELLGEPIDPVQAIVIGDTPADIACARANGCRVIAVATGPIDRAALAAHAPDLLLDDLTDAAAVVEFIAAEGAHVD